jgi:hypothetical protein
MLSLLKFCFSLARPDQSIARYSLIWHAHLYHTVSESEKHKDPRNKDPRKAWESEDGLPKMLRVKNLHHK